MASDARIGEVLYFSSGKSRGGESEGDDKAGLVDSGSGRAMRAWVWCGGTPWLGWINHARAKQAGSATRGARLRCGRSRLAWCGVGEGQWWCLGIGMAAAVVVLLSLFFFFSFSISISISTLHLGLLCMYTCVANIYTS